MCNIVSYWDQSRYPYSRIILTETTGWLPQESMAEMVMDARQLNPCEQAKLFPSLEIRIKPH